MTLHGTSVWMCVVVSVSLIQHRSHATTVAGLSVDPPENIKITDPGHLGQLNIEWNRPSSLENLTDCTIRYQLRYFDTYTKRWKSVRTLRLFYTAQFDLEKPVQVRMLTLLKGACTSGTEILGDEVEVVNTPEHSGVPGSRIKDFGCVYFNKEYMECTWESGSAEASDSKHYLYYWHREMRGTEECPEYIPSPEIRRGCRFPSESLLEFSDFNICVNGSSVAGALKPAFYSLAVQNHVKPAPVSDLQVFLNDTMLRAEWEPPAGPVPDQCLEYQFERATVSQDGSKQQQTSLTEETILKFHQEPENTRNCIRVRSKVNAYCADTGFWSEWSRSMCDSETGPKMTDYKPLWNGLPLILACGVIVVFIFCLTLWIFSKMWRNRKEQKHVPVTLYQEKVQKVFPSIFSPVI
ncbi:interleukin-13 receptor subunit alpha-2 [Trichomycterus rosablanca]|uniref:interleukin-13 receptor subunit alpha-2 n=1 Tax=Trichomycterus rosablanca TaxID=2290929 RepID=UPI002F353893